MRLGPRHRIGGGGGRHHQARGGQDAVRMRVFDRIVDFARGAEIVRRDDEAFHSVTRMNRRWGVGAIFSTAIPGTGPGMTLLRDARQHCPTAYAAWRRSRRNWKNSTPSRRRRFIMSVERTISPTMETIFDGRK